MRENEETFPDILELMRQASAARRVKSPSVAHEARGLWKTLEAFAETHPPTAVVASWRHDTGPEFGTMGTYLRATARRAQVYPCLAESGCGDPHEVVALEDGRWLARSPEDMRYCPGIWLTEADLAVYELDTDRLGRAVARALGFEAASARGASEAAPKMWPVGTHAETGSPVYLALCPNEGQLMLNLQGLLAVCRAPFIVLSPTARYRSELIGSMLQRERCGFMALASCLVPEGNGFGLVAPVAPVLDRFKAGLASGMGLVKTVERIDRNIEAVARYRLSKGHGVWSLVFEGMEGVIEDCRAMTLLNHLLKHPQEEAMHAVELEAVVAGHGEGEADREAVVQEGSGGGLNAGSNRILKRKLRELKEAMDDNTLPESERDKAQEEFDELLRAASRGGKMADAATRAAERVGKALKRMQRDLAQAEIKPGKPNVVLRAFGEHVRKHVLVPSLRFAGLRGKRSAGRKAGSFIYERPPDVIWAD